MYIQLNKTEQNNFTGYKTKAKKLAKKQIAYWNLKTNYTPTNLDYYNKVSKEFFSYISRSNFLGKIFLLINRSKNKRVKYTNYNRYKRVKNTNYNRSEYLIKTLTTLSVNINNENLLLPDIRKILNTELNSKKRKETTFLLNEKLKPINENFRELIIERNNYSKKMGFENYYEYYLNRLNIDYKKINNYIDEVKNNKTYKENLNKRDEILSDFFNIPKEDLKDYHRSISLMSLLGLNSYITKDNYFDITKQAYKGMGFDIDEYIKNKNLKYDLYPRENKYNSGMCLPISTNQIRLLTNLNDDINSLFVLFHEMGHAVHHLNISKKLPFKYRPDSLIAESVAMMMESLLYKENVLSEYIPKNILEKIKEYNKISETVLMARMISLLEFEKQAYENPDKDFNKLWNEIKSKNNFIEESDEEDFTYITNHFIQKPTVLIDYFKGLLIKEQFYKYLKDNIGGNLTENSKTSEILIKKLFRFGSLLKPKFLIKNLTNENIDSKYFLDSIKGVNKL